MHNRYVSPRTDAGMRGCSNGVTDACSSSSLRMGNAKENDMYIGGGALLLLIILVIVLL